MKAHGAASFLKANNPAKWCGLLAAVIVAGCAADTAIRRGLAYQEQGDYLHAYRYFHELVRQSPRNQDYRIYENTARGLAFRQAVGQAEKCLAAGNLDGFLAGMKQANEIQPGERIRTVIQLVENSRARGMTDSEVRAELERAMGADGATEALTTALAGTIDLIREQIKAGRLKIPVSVMGFTYGDSGRATDATAYFENALSEELVKSGIPVVERKKLEKILSEIKLSTQGLADQKQAIELGVLSGALSIVTGNLFPWERQVKYQARVLDVESSRIVLQDTRVFVPDDGFRRLLGN